jgi:hypothetical protein
MTCFNEHEPYCLARLKRPPENGPEQLLVPEYVPEMADAETAGAVPSIVTLQPGEPDMDPAAIVNVNDVLESDPARVPLKATVPSEDLAVTSPATEVADCETVHVIVPAPVESDAEPE